MSAILAMRWHFVQSLKRQIASWENYLHAQDGRDPYVASARDAVVSHKRAVASFESNPQTQMREVSDSYSQVEAKMALLVNRSAPTRRSSNAESEDSSYTDFDEQQDGGGAARKKRAQGVTKKKRVSPPTKKKAPAKKTAPKKKS